jgi:transcriptional regulator with XRE-family HTH domain
MDIDGEKLRRARHEARMSQQCLAVAAGIGYSTIWVLETGRQTSAKNVTIEKIAAALGRTPASLAPDPSPAPNRSR